MANTQTVTKAITSQGILPLFYNSNEQISKGVLTALYKAGIRAVEYTNRGGAALSNFKQLIELRNVSMPDLLLGIGTIKSLADAKAFLDVGADFLISPGLVTDVADYAVKNNIFYAPGCMTPTEIIAAEQIGLNFIKLFPGNLLGPEFLGGIKEIFPELLFMPTGGVDTTMENISGWFKVGVCAVGMGSKLVSKSLMEAQDYNGIEMATAKVLQLIQSIK